jgi:hypothetical protein
MIAPPSGAAAARVVLRRAFLAGLCRPLRRRVGAHEGGPGCLAPCAAPTLRSVPGLGPRPRPGGHVRPQRDDLLFQCHGPILPRPRLSPATLTFHPEVPRAWLSCPGGIPAADCRARRCAVMRSQDAQSTACMPGAPRTCGRQATPSGGRRLHDGHRLSLIPARGCITIQGHHAPLT